MKKVFFTPGPSQLYPTVTKHIGIALRDNIASVSHRGELFHEIYENTQISLRKLLKIPRKHRIFFLSSGTEAMERIIENTVGSTSTHFVNGAFSERFWQIASSLGKKATKIVASEGAGFNLAGVKIDKNTELVCFTHNETSTGVTTALSDIYKIKKENRDILVAVDTVSSAPYANINYKYVDICFFSVQKGFGLPAGLGVVIVNPDVLKASEVLRRKNYPVGTYHSFGEISKYDQKFETPETPNVLAIYLLGKVAQDMLKIGMRRIRKEIENKADFLYSSCEGKEGLEPFVKDERFRSKTVIVLETKSDSLTIINRLKKRGLVVGSGYKDFKSKHIRIANFPAHTLADFKRLIRELKK